MTSASFAGSPDSKPPGRIEKHLASPETSREIRRAGRGGGSRTVTAAEKAQAREVSLRRIGRLFAPYRWQLAIVTAIIAASSVVGLASPFLLRAVIDNALPERNVRLLAWLVIGMVGVAAVTSAFGVIQTWISTKVGQQVMHGLRTSVFGHLQQQSIAFFTKTRTGEVQSRITNDIGGMESVVTSTATSIAANLTTAVATAAAMVALSWRLSLISLVVMPPSIYLSRKVARMRRAITTQQQRELADLNVTIEEGLSINGIQLAKTMGTGPSLVGRFTASSARLIDLELQSQLAGRWRMASLEPDLRRDPGGYLPRGRLPITAGVMTIGTLIAFTTLQNGLFRPSDRPAQHRRLGRQLAGAVRPDLRVPRPAGRDQRPGAPGRGRPGRRCRPRDLLRRQLPVRRRRPRCPDRHQPGRSGRQHGRVGRRDRLGQDHPGVADPPPLRPGQAGVSASTASTCAICGSTDLASIVGVVSQETYLLHATVRENLRYARPEATDAEIEDAARAAQIHELIASLPDGYDTMVGSRGHRFSGGEKQRIAIARTLLRDPRVLVLDEATSALDTETERAVQQAFDRLARGRTTITIAHRLSTVRNADQIVVLHHGRVIEAGCTPACSQTTAGTRR